MFELVLFDEGLKQAIGTMFRSGFYSTEEIVEFFHEIASDDPDAGLDVATVDNEVRNILVQAADTLAKESAHWPEKTDNDGLTDAFQCLNESGIRAVENYGYEASDCLELYREIRGQAFFRGYCFYHNQDLIRAVFGGGLAIRFSSATDHPSDNDNRVIGEEVCNELRAHGLEPVWSGDSRNVIQLSIEWRRRPPGQKTRQP